MGDNAEGVLARLPFHLAERPSEILLLIGANNALATSLPDAYIQVMAEIADLTYSANIPLTIISVLPQSFNDADTINQYNAKLQALCDSRNVRFLNIHDEYLKGGKFNQALFIDEVHPNGSGYEKMRSLFDSLHAI